MSPRLNRLGYLVCVVVLAVLLVVYGQAYLLCMLVLLLCLGLTQVLGVRRDARGLQLQMACQYGCHVGGELQLTLRVKSQKSLLVAKYALAELEVHNEMLGTSRFQQIMVPLREQESPVQLQLPAKICGAVSLHCRKVQVWDLLEICCAQAAPSAQAYTVIWPRGAEVQLVPSMVTPGSSQTEGAAQNRRGSDMSEIFDFKEYAPGDDVRAIHWKLSSKTDRLMLREPSDPAHYDIALMPDTGLARRAGSITPAELNGAAALTLALGRQILESGMHFCLLFPTRQGLVQREIRTAEALQKTLPLWLSEPLSPQAGMGLQLFLAERLEQSFTRLLIVSAGLYEQDLQALSGRVGISVVCAAEQEAPVYTAISPGCAMAVLPADPKQGERFRVMC